MKTLKFVFIVLGLTLSSLTFNSCLDDDGYSLGDMWVSIATARPYGDNSFYLTLDDSTTLWPAAPLNINYQPTRPQRVQINYTKLGDNFQGFDHAIRLNHIDTILTKPIAENLGVAANDSIYGNDPVEITYMGVGDGFLTIEFKVYSSLQVKHFLNLIKDESSSVSPYMLEFRHNAYGDNSSVLRYGFVAFDLSSLSLEKGTTLSVKVQTMNGEKVFEIKV